MRNIEIKAPLPDRGRVEAALVALGAREVWTQHQRDTFFRVEEGLLKMREQDGRAELIAYRRSTDSTDPRPSDYHRRPLDDAAAWQTLLAHVHPVESVVEKDRTLWLFENTRIHLDRVEGLGDFLELETVLDGIDEESGRVENDLVIEKLALQRDTFLAVPYKTLLTLTR